MAANVRSKNNLGEAGLPVSVAPLRLLWHLSADQAGPLAPLTMDLPLGQESQGPYPGRRFRGYLSALCGQDEALLNYRYTGRGRLCA